jgi:hypothetical protein
MSSNNDQSSKIYYTSKDGAIKKLDGTNYIEWKGDISAILSAPTEAISIYIHNTDDPVMIPLISPSKTHRRREPGGSSHGFKVGKRSLHP